MKILCCGIFPALQRTLEMKSLKLGAVNRVRSVTLSVGGKATNAARVLNTLGGDPLLFGFAGGNNGAVIKRLLDDEGITHAFVGTNAETRTSQTLLADDAHDFTELVEEGPELPAKDWKSLIKKFQMMEKEIIIISGTLPAHAPQEIYAELIQAADGKPVILDTSGKPLLAALEFQPELVKINAAELLKTMNSDNIEDAAQEMIAQGAGAVAITQGSQPALLITREETVQFSVPKVNVVSTLGCGDSVNAGIAFALRKGSSLKEAFVFGLACGASNAMNRLPGVVMPEQIAALVPQIKIQK
ncbi:MAG: 1-phosphofructokinase family hexose kinase [Kiritimatiellaceae bacterium]|nr:1-phosphofructokinase family hexose kinase [Kiritimatiellaceae bacterium]